MQLRLTLASSVHFLMGSSVISKVVGPRLGSKLHSNVLQRNMISLQRKIDTAYTSLMLSSTYWLFSLSLSLLSSKLFNNSHRFVANFFRRPWRHHSGPGTRMQWRCFCKITQAISRSICIIHQLHWSIGCIKTKAGQETAQGSLWNQHTMGTSPAIAESLWWCLCVFVWSPLIQGLPVPWKALQGSCKGSHRIYLHTRSGDNKGTLQATQWQENVRDLHCLCKFAMMSRGW